jgi:hypothetical protein
LQPEEKKQDACMTKKIPSVEKMLEEIDIEASMNEKTLRDFIKRLLEARDEIDYRLKRAVQSLRVLEGTVPLADEPGEIVEARVERRSHIESERRRGEAGQAVYTLMASAPVGRLFTFRQLQQCFGREISFMWPKIVADWNRDHPAQQIKDNGLPKAQRKYYLESK